MEYGRFRGSIFSDIMISILGILAKSREYISETLKGYGKLGHSFYGLSMKYLGAARMENHVEIYNTYIDQDTEDFLNFLALVPLSTVKVVATKSTRRLRKCKVLT